MNSQESLPQHYRAFAEKPTIALPIRNITRDTRMSDMKVEAASAFKKIVVGLQT